MLALDDPIWSELSHCYRDGSDVPEKLSRIEASDRLPRKFWDDFTNLLCHQCTIGTASLAAFPHLVRIAGTCPQEKKATDCINLASFILMLALGPDNRLPRMPRTIARAFRDAISDGRKTLLKMYGCKRRTMKDQMLYLSAVATFDQRADIGSILGELCLGWFDCPKCETRVVLSELPTW